MLAEKELLEKTIALILRKVSGLNLKNDQKE
jgi:hypothetical protein